MSPPRRPKVPYFTKLDPALLAALRAHRTATGCPVNEALDRAVRLWLAHVAKTTAPRTRKRTRKETKR